MEEKMGLTIQIPKEKMSFTGLQNLKAILKAKSELICKALGTDNLEIETREDTIAFPWFETMPSPDEIRAYTDFITMLCDNANNSKWVTSKGRTVENEKYAFRCFLLRLGFIGDEYKADRKILLRNLSGSSAFRLGKEEPEDDGQESSSEGEESLS